ncbi:hypothetical protein [Tardiphaga sp. 862_B3_N1_1]|uniref:hypothetical protein n=1 Tax=Tardiphaga sp. 862_B3_N1_1 TaxID=3240763 RepID=UPI003F8C5487
MPMHIFRLGAEKTEAEFESNDAAIAFAQRMAREISFWDFKPGSILKVFDDDGEVLLEIPLKRQMH